MVSPEAVVEGLVARGVPRAAAIGMAGNIAVESGFDPGINEIAPIVPGSRGGFGLIQWTGPRRRQFESYAGENLADLDTQLDFLVHELNTTESRARDAIYAAQDPVEAARLVSDKFLRPGIPHMDRRIEETRKIAGMAGRAQSASQGRNALAGIPAPQQPMNALAEPPQPVLQYNALQLDPSAFFSRRTV